MLPIMPFWLWSLLNSITKTLMTCFNSPKNKCFTFTAQRGEALQLASVKTLPRLDREALFSLKQLQRPHHRGSSCPIPPKPCGWAVADDKTASNQWILYGALVGGPDRLDGYKDDRKDYKQSEVTLDYNAGFTGATAGLLYYMDLNYIDRF